MAGRSRPKDRSGAGAAERPKLGNVGFPPRPARKLPGRNRPICAHRCRSVERGSSSKADIPPADLPSCNTRGVDIDDPKAMTIFVRNLNGTLKRLARKEPRLVDGTRDG